MVKYLVRFRERIERFFRPRIWWSLWTLGVLYFLYMLVFNAILLLKNNYGLPGEIALGDMYAGKLILLATNIPLVSFTCLFAGHLALALYKTDKFKNLKKSQA